MKENQKIFLNQFDQPLRKHIINFCNAITGTKYDVYILLARKAACFVDTLLELDLIEINGTIVSDRVLEYDTGWLEGKSVAIIDDTIISGTSIYKLIQKLEKIAIFSVDVFAFCINEYWFVEDMLAKADGTSYLNKPFLKLDHTTSLRFCKQIVDALAISPRPYNIDFPIYEKIKLSNEKLEKLLASNYWRIVDTSSRKQLEHDIFCWTLNPRKSFTALYNKKVGWNINQVAHFKLRMYTQKIVDPQKKTTYIAKVVPYIIFNAISVDNADRIIGTICANEKLDTAKLTEQLITENSKLIFIQYYYAKKLFETWSQCVSEILDLNGKQLVNERSLYFLFSPKILGFIDAMVKTEEDLIPLQSDLFLSDHIIADKHDLELNPITNQYNLIEPFLNLYYEKELPARRIVKKVGREAFKDMSFIEILNRLEDGISISFLKTKIAKALDEISDINQVLSLFLDIYVDNGLIVPITVHKNGYLYRGYRHGEEVPWGNYNNRLLGRYFQRYLKNVDSQDLTQTYFQKLLVLFLKIGVKEGVLEEYSTLTPSKLKTRLMGVKAHLFGMVSDYTELEPMESKVHLPIIDSKAKSYWTSSFLSDRGMILLNQKKNYEFNFEKFEVPYINDMEVDEPSDLSEEHLDKTHNIADMFGYLKKEGKIDEEALVLLTSCVNLHDNTASLAAELQIYLNRIEAYKYQISSNLSQGFTIEKLKSLRDREKNHIWTAINSGKFKFASFLEGKGAEFIHEITKFLEDGGKLFESRAWKQYWRSDTDLVKNEENELVLIGMQMGDLLLEANIVIACVHVYIYELLNRNRSFEQYFALLEQENESYRGTVQEIGNKIKDLRKKDNGIEGQKNEVETLMIDTLSNKRTELNKKIKDNREAISSWKDYEMKNQTFIMDAANILFSRNIPFNAMPAFSEVSSRSYKSVKDSDLNTRISELVSILDELTLRIKPIMDEYKLTVPEWGKVQQKVKFNNFIHINSKISEQPKREDIAKIIKHYLSEFEIEEFGNESDNKTITSLRVPDAKTGDGQVIGLRGQLTLDRVIKLSCKLLSAFHEKKIIVSITGYLNFKDGGVDCYFNNQTKNFDTVKENLFGQFDKPAVEGEVRLYDHQRKNSLSDIIHYKLKYFQDKYDVQNCEKGIETGCFSITINNKFMTKQTIGVVTALPKEFAAMKQIMDIKDVPFPKPSDDLNDYTIGYIKTLDGQQVKVVVAMMKEMGTNDAASTTTNLLRSFPEINDVIVCGIAGAVPNIEKPDAHVRLGDIVVSDRNGVLQYDNIKETEDHITIRSAVSKPSSLLLGKVNVLISEFESNQRPWFDHIKKHAGSLRYSERPDPSLDKLKIGEAYVEHPTDRDRNLNEPKVFHGPIGSSNILLKNEKKRDQLRDKYGVKAIEMEASGIASGTWNLSKEYLVVRGTVDYCNDDKNDEWHNYAAICAACYTKALIERL